MIAVDMDGTIVKNKWPEIGPFRFGAKWCLKWMKRRGHELILNTCREHSHSINTDKQCLLCDARGFLIKEIFNFDYYNQNTPELIAQYGGDCRKISADWMIDDKAGFLGWWSIPLIVLWLEFKNRMK